MFTRYSIRQLMLATAGMAVLISIVAVGIQKENLMGWGAIISLALLPVLFLSFGFVVMMANAFCSMGNSMLGPLKTTITRRSPVEVATGDVPAVHEESNLKPFNLSEPDDIEAPDES